MNKSINYIFKKKNSVSRFFLRANSTVCRCLNNTNQQSGLPSSATSWVWQYVELRGGGVLGVGGGSGRACLFGALAECLFFSAIQWESTWVTRSHIHWNKVENANAPRSRFLLGSGAALVSLLSCPNDDGDNTRGGQASDGAKGRLGKDGGVQGEGWAVVISLIWNAASYDISVIHAAFWLTLY